MVLVVDIISLFGDYFSMKCFVLRYTSNDMSYQSLLTVVSTFLQSSTSQYLSSDRRKKERKTFFRFG